MMDALKFIKELKEDPNTVKSNLSAAEYFETAEGKQMIRVISKEVRIVLATSFELVDWNVPEKFEKNPLYRGRNFFTDMEELGFTWKLVSGREDGTPIYTYMFSPVR